MDATELKPCEDEIADQLEKCRIQYMMDDSVENIDPLRIETLRNLSKQNYDEIETRPGASNKAKVAAFAEKLWLRNRHVSDANDNMKISKLHKRLLKIESMATR